MPQVAKVRYIKQIGAGQVLFSIEPPLADTDLIRVPARTHVTFAGRRRPQSDPLLPRRVKELRDSGLPLLAEDSRYICAGAVPQMQASSPKTIDAQSDDGLAAPIILLSIPVPWRTRFVLFLPPFSIMRPSLSLLVPIPNFRLPPRRI